MRSLTFVCEQCEIENNSSTIMINEEERMEHSDLIAKLKSKLQNRIGKSKFSVQIGQKISRGAD
jgi:hypothetical protein